MENNQAWEEDSLQIQDVDGNLAFEVIDVIKPNRLAPEVKKEPLSDWRKDLGLEG